MTNFKNNNKGSTNDGLALIVGGLFVLALVFATYSYFNRTPSQDKNIKEDAVSKNDSAEKETLSLGERIKELFNTDSKKGDINGTGGAMDDKSVDKSQVLGTGGPKVLYSVWEATDYQKGDISGGSYVVKSGDTLWEIAEAVYGNGAEWTKILEANSSSVGYLPSGEQALIMVGQTIVLP